MKRILHVSDLHIGVSPDVGIRTVLSQFVRDASVIAEDCEFDAVVVSGDLTASGNSFEFENALELFLAPLTEALQLSPQRVAIVPGNHDIDRNLVSNVQERGLEDILSSTEAVDLLFANELERDLALARMKHWNAFARSFYSEPIDIVSGGSMVFPPDLWDGEMGIAALDSAWRATGSPNDLDFGRLLVSESHAVNALNDIQLAPLRIVVMHHPLHWLAKWNHSLLRTEIERRGIVLFTGHEHVPDPTWNKSSRGSALYLPSASIYQGDRRLPIAYSIVDLNSRDQEAHVQIRSWKVGRQEFDDATEYLKDGEERFPLPRPHSQSQLEVPRYTAITQCLITAAQSLSSFGELLESANVRGLFDILVEPRFFPAPFNQIAATIAIARIEEKSTSRLLSFSISTHLDEVDVAIISGDALSGVSNALLWILGDRYERDGERVPLLVDYRRLSGADPLEALIRSVAPSFGLSGRPRDELPPLIVAIDDIEVDDEATLLKIVDHVRRHPSNKFIFGCHGTRGTTLASIFQASGIPVSHGYLGPFGVGQLRQLATKAGGISATQHVERVMSLVFDEHLPRSPFLLTAIVAVLSNNPAILPHNESKVLEAVISLLLGKHNPLDNEAGIDARGREDLLQEIARHFTLSGKDRLERREAESFVAQYFDDRGIEGSASPGNHLNAFISRRILIQDERGVGFRHRSFQDVVGATLMRVNRDFADELMSDPPRFADVLRHAAWLSRDDRLLLEKVSSATRPVIDDVIARNKSMFDKTLGKGVSDYTERQIDELLSVAAPTSALQHAQEVEDHFEIRELTDSIDLTDTIAPEMLNYMGASSLLSSVLAGSELVDDVPFKVNLLKYALQAWNSVAEEMGNQGQEWSAIRPIFEELFGDTPPELRQTMWQFFMRMSIVVGISLGATAELAVNGLSKAVRILSDDSDIQASPALDFMVTLLYIELKLPDQVSRLKEMYERHERHLIVSQMCRGIAMSQYLSPFTLIADVSELEVFLLDSMTTEAKGRNAVVGRSDERSRLRTKLQRERARHRDDQFGAGVVDDLIALEEHNLAEE